jgi:hypothetical protein
MIIKPTNGRLGWDPVDFVAHNQAAYHILAGEPVCWDIVTAKDGSVARPITLTLDVPAGITLDTLGTSGQYNDVGRIRGYGYCKAWCTGSTFTPGAQLAAASADSNLTLAVSFAHAASTIEAVTPPKVFAIAATTGCLLATSTYGASYQVFVRALK